MKGVQRKPLPVFPIFQVPLTYKNKYTKDSYSGVLNSFLYQYFIKLALKFKVLITQEKIWLHRLETGFFYTLNYICFWNFQIWKLNSCFFVVFLFFVLDEPCREYGVLFPQQGMKPMSPAVEAQIFNLGLPRKSHKEPIINLPLQGHLLNKENSSSLLKSAQLYSH